MAILPLPTPGGRLRALNHRQTGRAALHFGAQNGAMLARWGGLLSVIKSQLSLDGNPIDVSVAP
jgi:hypothetical protein